MDSIAGLNHLGTPRALSQRGWCWRGGWLDDETNAVAATTQGHNEVGVVGTVVTRTRRSRCPGAAPRDEGDVTNAFDYDVEDYLTYLAAHGYASTTVRGRRYHLNELSRYLEARGLTDPRLVTPSTLESYQRHLFHHKKSDGTALSFATQAQRLVPVKGFFSFLVKTGASNFDPALGLTLPKTERRLPEAVLGVDEVEAVLAEPDTTTPLGLRDRAILEVFYSTAIRRMELINLQVGDIDVARGSLFVRQGKGARDRFVPIGERARYWVGRYLQDVRPQLQRDTHRVTLFLTSTGLIFASDVMTRLVGAYVRSGTGTKRGSCHLFRHTTATLMLDAGADVRHVAEMLGHQNLETTMQYTRVSMAKLQEVHARCHPAERQTSLNSWGHLAAPSSQLSGSASRIEPRGLRTSIELAIGHTGA